LINISHPLPKPPPTPLDLVRAGKTAARQLRQRADTETLTLADAERFMDRIDAGFAAALALAASAPPAGQPFTVIKGGRS
jgi:hypothetical protein